METGENGNVGENTQAHGEGSQQESTQEGSTSVLDSGNSDEQVQASGEGGSESEPEPERAEVGQVMQGLCKATFIPANKMLLIDLSSLQNVTGIEGDGNLVRVSRQGTVVTEQIAQQFPTPAPVDQPRRKRQKGRARASQPTRQAAQTRAHTEPKSNGNGDEKVSIEPGKKIKIHPPAPGMVVRADQTLMLKLSKDGSADILQTENWGYPKASITPDSLHLKAKPTSNFLNFQEPQDGYRFAWLVNLEKQEVIQIAKKGKFLVKEIEGFMEKGFSEFIYASGQSGKHFRLPDGTVVASKRMLDLSPEETKKEAKRSHNKPSTGTLVGALSGTLKG